MFVAADCAYGNTNFHEQTVLPPDQHANTQSPSTIRAEMSNLHLCLITGLSVVNHRPAFWTVCGAGSKWMEVEQINLAHRVSRLIRALSLGRCWFIISNLNKSSNHNKFPTIFGAIWADLIGAHCTDITGSRPAGHPENWWMTGWNVFLVGVFREGGDHHLMQGQVIISFQGGIWISSLVVGLERFSMRRWEEVGGTH